MNSIKRIETCAHPSAHKIFSWKEETFTNSIGSLYEYCFCKSCNDEKYTGVYKFVTTADLNRKSTKEQVIMEKLSVSCKIKAMWTKAKSNLSLKQFARSLSGNDSKVAQDWFANKNGILNGVRSDKNKIRVSAEKTATKLARRSKKKGAGGSAKADVKVAAVVKAK